MAKLMVTIDNFYERNSVVYECSFDECYLWDGLSFEKVDNTGRIFPKFFGVHQMFSCKNVETFLQQLLLSSGQVHMLVCRKPSGVGMACSPVPEDMDEGNFSFEGEPQELVKNFMNEFLVESVIRE